MTMNVHVVNEVNLWDCAERSFSGKSLIHIGELSKQELVGLLRCAKELKAAFGKDNGSVNVSNSESSNAKFNLAAKSLPLLGRSVGMIFQKRSTRTRVSTETGIGMLGGRALFLGPGDIQLNVNETLHDTAQVLSKFNSIILARVFSHDDVKTLRDSGSVPVINALSDLHHPLQTLADLMTLQEQFGDLKGRTVTWVGDGSSNVLHDLMLGCAMMGVNVNFCSPSGYEPYYGVLNMAQRLASKSGSTVKIFNDPSESVRCASAVFTDTWISMGQEDEEKARKEAFSNYQVTQELMAKANSDAIFLHCLPRHQEEVTDEVFYGKQSMVFPAAENRMWTVMAVALSILS